MINQYPQYCNGGDLADYLNGKFSFALFLIPLRKLNLLFGIWSFYWESLIFFSFSEGNIERRHNSAFSATIRWEDDIRLNSRLFQEDNFRMPCFRGCSFKLFFVDCLFVDETAGLSWESKETIFLHSLEPWYVSMISWRI